MATVIHHLEQLDSNKAYSYADYLLWEFEQRIELLKGKIFLMPPAPIRIHQTTATNLLVGIGNFLKNKKLSCSLFSALFDVRLIDIKKITKSKKLNNEEIFTVVQPDIGVICDKSKLDEKGCIGSPDFIIEILSEARLKKDLNLKFHLYEENGVKEYWIADPNYHLIHQYFLNEAKHKYEIVGYFTEEDSIQSVLFPELIINVSEIFKD